MNSLPLAVVYVLGLVMALMQMQRLPRVAAAAGGGFGALLLILMVQPLVSTLIYAAFRSDGQTISVLHTLSDFVFNLFKAMAIGAIGYAIFADRPEVQLPISGQKLPSPQPWGQR